MENRVELLKFNTYNLDSDDGRDTKSILKRKKKQKERNPWKNTTYILFLNEKKRWYTQHILIESQLNSEKRKNLYLEEKKYDDDESINLCLEKCAGKAKNVCTHSTQHIHTHT